MITWLVNLPWWTSNLPHLTCLLDYCDGSFSLFHKVGVWDSCCVDDIVGKLTRVTIYTSYVLSIVRYIIVGRSQWEQAIGVGVLHFASCSGSITEKRSGVSHCAFQSTVGCLPAQLRVCIHIIQYTGAAAACQALLRVIWCRVPSVHPGQGVPVPLPWPPGALPALVLG